MSVQIQKLICLSVSKLPDWDIFVQRNVHFGIFWKILTQISMILTCWGLGPAEPEDRLGPTEEINEVLGEVGADPVLESILSWRIEAMPKSNGLDTVADIPDDPEDSAEPTGESWKKWNYN